MFWFSLAQIGPRILLFLGMRKYQEKKNTLPSAVKGPPLQFYQNGLLKKVWGEGGRGRSRTGNTKQGLSVLQHLKHKSLGRAYLMAIVTAQAYFYWSQQSFADL